MWPSTILGPVNCLSPSAWLLRSVEQAFGFHSKTALCWNLAFAVIYVAPPELYAFAWPAFLGFAPEATAHGCSAANRKCSCQGRVLSAIRCGAAAVGSLW